MKALLLVLATSGCATSWALSQATGMPQMWDEGARDVHVPEPGVTERFTIELPVAPPFALACHVDQDAEDVVYHSAFRYGSHWKYGTAIAFLAEGAAAALLYAGKTDDHPEDVAYAGAFAIDAIASGALFFAPRKDIYRHDERAVTTRVRTDCPDGLALAIAGNDYPVDAAGRVGELGDAALAQWLKTGGEPLEAHLDGQSRTLSRGAAATFVVAPGTLARR